MRTDNAVTTLKESDTRTQGGSDGAEATNCRTRMEDAMGEGRGQGKQGLGTGLPYLPLDESVDDTAVLIEPAHFEGLVQRVVDAHAIADSYLCVRAHARVHVWMCVGTQKWVSSTPNRCVNALKIPDSMHHYPQPLSSPSQLQS